MYVITNRQIQSNAAGLKKFGREPNSSGPNELRLLEIDDNDSHNVTELNDALTKPEIERLIADFELDINPDDQWYQSLRVACALYEKSRESKKHILLYVHGYNNDIEDVFDTALELQRTYNILVVPFTWPANGGGALSGTAAYLVDKEDARVSATALSRTIEKVATYHAMLTRGLRQQLSERAARKHPDNSDAARALFNQLLKKSCNQNISLLCHSMGNYVLKHASIPSGSGLRTLTFDNIALVAADVNNPGHREWVESLPTRNRLYIVINENDGPLGWSRKKPGEEQAPRLGHHIRQLDARNAYYIDVTRNKGVGDDHSYFKGKPIRNNATLRKLFEQIFCGEDAEKGLEYHADLNVYRSS